MASTESQRGLTMALVFSAVALLIAVLIAPYAFWLYSWRDTTPRGPLIDPATWPLPIRDLHTAMDRASVVTDGFEVYLVYGRPGDTDSTVICRMSDASQTFEFLNQQLELRPVAAEKMARINSEATTLAPADWWASPSGKVQMFASRRLLEGDEADLYVVARDPARSRLYIHYHFNF